MVNKISWVFLLLQCVYKQNEVVGVAIQGTINVLKSCVKAKTVKRVVFTSSSCAMSPLNEEGKMNNNPCSLESFWSPVNHFRSNKQQFPIWVLSKLFKWVSLDLIYLQQFSIRVLPNFPSGYCLNHLISNDFDI